jgi:hypothetical protein
LRHRGSFSIAHGLGHLRAPYDKDNPAKNIPKPAGKSENIEDNLKTLGVELWQHDLWWQIVRSALSGNPDRVDHTFHAALDKPAVSRYGATTPKLLRWFDEYNEGRTYGKQVKPFGFLYSLFVKRWYEAEPIEEFNVPSKKPRHVATSCKPVAPYDKNLAKAIKKAFDRETGMRVQANALRSYKQVIADYHVHAESKFLNGGQLDWGITRRRYLRAVAFQNIGKEANEWEEQFYLGFDEEEQIDYGLGPKSKKDFLEAVRAGIESIGQREVSRISGVSRRTLARLMEGQSVRSKVVAKIVRVLKQAS